MIDYAKLRAFVEEKQTGHPFAGFDHVQRVHDICLKLADGLEIDRNVLECAAYLHDIAVPVFGPEQHYERAQEAAGDILAQVGLPKEKHKLVFDAIKTHTRYIDVTPETIEGKVLKDADGIDYLGAIGIMRGVLRSYRNKSYSGNVSTEGKQTLTKLVDKVDKTFSTEKGKAMAKERIDFISGFLRRLDEEIAHIS